MRKDSALGLNTHFFVRRVETTCAKLWLLAERIGVNRKTVSRWASGKVKRIERSNAARLAEALDCKLEDLVLSDEGDVFATRHEQRTAAQLLESRDLLAILSPGEEWELAQALIKASLEPDLPLRRLGQLENLLSITAWRLARYDEAQAHAARARLIGDRTGDRSILTTAIYNQATIDSLVGRHREAREGYEACLGTPEHFDSPRTHASVLFNLSMVYRDFALFRRALECQNDALRRFEVLARPFNLAIGYTGRGIVLTELGRLSEALEALETAARHAHAGQVLRYEEAVDLYRGDALALRGDLAPAIALVSRGFEGLVRRPMHDLECHAIAARAARLAGRLAEAERRITDGVLATREFPTARAMLLEEHARLALAQGNPALECRLRARANALWSRMGLDARMRATPVVEYGAMFERS